VPSPLINTIQVRLCCSAGGLRFRPPPPPPCDHKVPVLVLACLLFGAAGLSFFWALSEN
jgi:hypothetical protein